MNALLPAFVVLLASASAPAPVPASSPAAAVEPKVGDRAPDFSLPSDDGGTFTLSAAKKPVAVVFYPRAFTGGCTKQLTAFAGAKDALSSRETTVVAVSVDDAPTVKKFKESLGATYPFLSDDDATVAKAYGVYDAGRDYARRVTFVVGEDGTITHVERDNLSPDGVLAACPPKAAAPAGGAPAKGGKKGTKTGAPGRSPNDGEKGSRSKGTKGS